jgi:hypothetical protein
MSWTTSDVREKGSFELERAAVTGAKLRPCDTTLIRGGQVANTAALIAGLPGSSATVRVGPPLSAREPSRRRSAEANDATARQGCYFGLNDSTDLGAEGQLAGCGQL